MRDSFRIPSGRRRGVSRETTRTSPSWLCWFASLLAGVGTGGCWSTQSGYIDTAAPRVTLVPSGQARVAGIESAEIRMVIDRGVTEGNAFREFMRHAQSLGAVRVSDVEGRFIRVRHGRQLVCSVAFGPESEERTRHDFVHKTIPEGEPRGAMVTKRENVCEYKPVTERGYETVSRDEYNPATGRYERRTRQEYKTRTDYKNVCEWKTVHEWDRNAGYRTPARTELEIVSTTTTHWSLDSSEPDCKLAEAGAVGVMTGRAAFPLQVPDAARRTSAIPLPKTLDCEPCERLRAWRVACGDVPESSGVKTPSEEASRAPRDETISLDSLDQMEAGEARLRGLIGRPVMFSLRDGAVVVGTLTRVHAWKCQLDLPDNTSHALDLLDAVSVTVGAKAPGAAPIAFSIDCQATPPEGCSPVCDAHIGRLANRASTASLPSGPRARAGDGALTHLRLGDLDALQEAEEQLLAHIGGAISVTLTSGEHVSGTLLRVHMAMLTIRQVDGDRVYLPLEDLRDIELGSGDSTPN